LVIALVISLLLHLNILLLVQVWPALIRATWVPSWIKPVMAAVMPQQPPPRAFPLKQPAQPEEIPLQFVEVDPSQATDQPVPDTKYMSTANTLAANPNPTKETGIPRIDGKREDSMKTFDTPTIAKAVEAVQAAPPPPKTMELAKIAPAPRPATPKPLTKPEPKTDPRPVSAKPATDKGETELATATPVQPQTAEQEDAAAEATEQRHKPLKNVREAMAAKGLIIGDRMKQDGGVQRAALDSSLNAKASPFGDYNYRMVQAVQSRWYELLDNQKFAFERSGRVVVKFMLNSDGTATQVKTEKSEVGETYSLLCTLAIDQAQSFGPWPSELKRLMGRDSIEVTFTFSYIFN
jgi:hypothetical protein